MRYKVQIGKVVVSYGLIFANSPPDCFVFGKIAGSEFDGESNQIGESFGDPVLTKLVFDKIKTSMSLFRNLSHG